MNTWLANRVEGPKVMSQAAGIALYVCLATVATGCVEVNGGAVEASWTVRTFEGNTTSCAAVGLETIRICWESIGGDARIRRCAEFDCEANRGITKFSIPAGPTAIFLEPVCTDGILARTYEVPPPIVRTIKDGDVATLNQLLIVATENRDCSAGACTCP